MEKLMERKFVQIAALCLSAALFMTAVGGSASAAPLYSNDRIIRVGLHYGTGAIEGLNLENETGSGFRFGYYDNANQFVELGFTVQRAISVVETMNVYYGTYDKYTSYHTALTSSSVAVGEYHLQLPGSYTTFAEAQMVSSAYGGGFPACIGGVFYARIGNYTTRDRAVAAQMELAGMGVSTDLCGTSGYGVSVVITGTNTILFQYDDVGNGTGLGIEPNQVDDGERYTTWSKKFLYYGGFRFERIDGGDLTVVNILGLEDYVKGVVPIEMSDSWPLEALKAQAVAARSYALSLGSKHSKHHFDICAETDCQAYGGLNRAGANSNAAVDQTAGQVATYNGQIAHTCYYASNGGASENSSVVYETSQSNHPYLIGKADPYEGNAPIPDYSWSRSFSSATLVSKLRGLGYNVGGAITSIAVTALTEMGNPKMVTFTDSNGKSYSISTKYVIQKMLYLPSYRYGFDTVAQTVPVPTWSINGSQSVGNIIGLYAIDGNGNVTVVDSSAYVITDSGVVQAGQGGTSGGSLGSLSSTTGSGGMFTFVGKGSGHNVGMSQWGAYAMAQQGYTYLDILQFYYTGITVGYM